jgi:hypothetical protein
MRDWFQRDVTPDEESQIQAFMARLASVPLRGAPQLPTVDVILVKAELLRRWDNDRKVQAPLDVMEPVQIAAGLAAAALLLIWSLPSLLQWLPLVTG